MSGAFSAFRKSTILKTQLYNTETVCEDTQVTFQIRYLLKKRKRDYRVNVNYLDHKDYCSVESLLKTGNIFGTDMCYSLIPDYLDPYDYETFDKYEGKAYAVVTNIRTGEPEYMQLKDMHKDIIAVQASSSMPLVSRNVKIGEDYYLDGGISDFIELALMKIRYARYPKVYELMRDRHIRYNNTVQYIEEQQKQGNVFVIRPKHVSNVGRLEKDKAKLDALYEEGYRDAENCYVELLEYLEK